MQRAITSNAETLSPVEGPSPTIDLRDPVDEAILRACAAGAMRRPEQRSPRQLERLAELASIELASGLTDGPGRTIQRICDVVHPLLANCGGVSVILFDRQRQIFSTSASTVPGQDASTAASRVRNTGGATRHIVDTGHGLSVPDARKGPFSANAMLRDGGNNCYVGLPIMVEGAAVGALYAMSERVGQFDDEDVEFLALVADRSAVVIQASQEHERVRRLAQQQELVAGVAALLSATDDAERMVADTAQRMATSLDLDTLAIIPVSASPAFDVQLAGRAPEPWAVFATPDEIDERLVQCLHDGIAMTHLLRGGHRDKAMIVAIRRGRELEVGDRATVEHLGALLATNLARARAMAELRSSNDSLAQFANVVSHDLRTPVASISGMLELALSSEGDAVPAEARSFVQYALGSAHRMAQTIEALLKGSGVRVEAAEHAATPLAVLVEAVLVDLDASLRASNAVVEVQERLPSLRVDAAAFRVVLQNLIANAIKFTRPGVPPRISVKATMDEEHVRILVADQGAGVPEGERNGVFEMFDRGSGTHVAGSGIGLSTVARLVEAHAGAVWLEPNQPHGTIAVVELPRAGRPRRLTQGPRPSAHVTP